MKTRKQLLAAIEELEDEIDDLRTIYYAAEDDFFSAERTVTALRNELANLEDSGDEEEA